MVIQSLYNVPSPPSIVVEKAIIKMHNINALTISDEYSLETDDNIPE